MAAQCCCFRENMISILLFLFIFCLISISAFNVDIKVPIVKIGERNSYFGYSVAHHHVHDKTVKGHKVILVGAPKDNVTDQGAPFEVRRLTRPGVVYQCPLTSYQQDCTPLKIDQIEPDPWNDDKNDQWMGVSVASQGTPDGKAIACSHRFKKIGPSFRWGLGLCISLTNALDEDKYFEPCNAKPKDAGHGEYGFCQAGISSALDEDGDLVLGSPGPVNWRGTIFMNSVADALDEDAAWFQAPVEDPLAGSNSPLPAMNGYYSYLGMSVKIGRIIGGRKTIVAGAPRAKDSGQVLLFQQVGKQLKVEQNHYLTGELFGSYFGYDVAIADFNIDGKEDLAVGAPFYHGPGVGGAVFIYMNGPEGITSLTKPIKILSRKMKDSECAELDCQNARFGFALASIGDINRDGFDDLAVGAPYEGKGAVYIFHGSPTGLHKEPAQRIYAGDFTSAVPEAFGSSLSGGADLDDNSYPDLVVGSFMSSNIHILRSRPIIDLHTVFEATPAVIDPKIVQCAKTGIARTCFTLRICVRFTAEPKDRFMDRITLLYTLEAEKFAGSKISRVQFNRTSPGGDTSSVTRALELNAQTSSDYKCDEELAYIVKETRDFLNPIPLQLTFKLKDEREPRMNPGDSLPDLNSFPILNAKNTILPLNVDFLKDCGDDSKCESDLSLTTRLSLVRDVEGDYVLKVGEDNIIELEFSVLNKGEDAHEAMVTATLPQSLKYLGPAESAKKYNCVPEDNIVRCAVGNPLKRRALAEFAIRLNTQSALPSNEKFTISVVVNTSSIELNTADDVSSMNLKVIVQTDLMVRGQSSPESVFFSGVEKGESVIEHEDEIGSEVRHRYEVKNIGKVRVPRSRVNVRWPYELPGGWGSSQGKHLFYVMDEPQLEGEGSCFFERRFINPRQFKPPRQKNIRIENGTAIAVTDEERPSRSKREAQGMNLKIGGGGVEVLDCDRNSARCFDFYCELGELLPGRSMVISIRSRLWNTTFLQHYTTAQEVLVYSRAEVIIDPKLEIKQTDTANDMDKAVTRVFPAKDVQETGGAPWWIILIGILVGVLLLVLLIIILWKCGFFKRQKHDQMMEHKAKVERNNYDEYHD